MSDFDVWGNRLLVENLFTDGNKKETHQGKINTFVTSLKI